MPLRRPHRHGIPLNHFHNHPDKRFRHRHKRLWRQSIRLLRGHRHADRAALRLPFLMVMVPEPRPHHRQLRNQTHDRNDR